MIPLFEQFPVLKERLPYIRLCDLPTPVFKLDQMGKAIGLDRLYIKQDGLTAQPFGGNKVRKLEFLLGDALKRGYKEVLTFGFAGSNHALATAVYANKLGLKSISMLMPQENARYVRQNLLVGHSVKAEFHYYPDKKRLVRGARLQAWRRRLMRGKAPYVIPSGGSCPLGAAGYVNAVLELKKQVEQNELPEPDRIYVAFGTAGTAVGLILGLKALGMKTRVVLIRVVDYDFMGEEKMRRLFDETADFLHENDPSFPRVEISAPDIDIRDRYFGEGYARFTKEGMEAVERLKETEDIPLDETYTGKTFSGLIDDARKGKLNNQVVLYWNTLNTHDVSNLIEGMDYHRLPGALHRYFEDAVGDPKPL